MYSKITIIISIIVILLLIGIRYSNYNEGLLIRKSSYPIFNLGTRELFPTRLMSYDVRGDVPIGYYPTGLFNQPEYPYHSGFYPSTYGYINTNFYTPEYVNPYLNFIPSIYNSNYSVPFKVNGKNSNNSVKPILDKPN